jgi:sensor histidine kinase YesM
MPSEILNNSWLNSPSLRRGLYASGKERAILHTIFWISLSCFTVYSNSWTLQGANQGVYIPVIVTDICLISVSYYFIVYVGLPKLYNNKWLQFLLCLFVVYLVTSYANYFLYNWLFKQFHVLKQLVLVFGENGFLYAPFHKYTLLINWSFTLSSLSIAVVVKVIKDILMARTKTVELERDNIRLELQFLQAQIQPHFVLNSINSVYSVVAGVDDEAATMLLRLSALLRYALHESANSTVSLVREVEFLSEYIGLEAVRQHERTTLSFQHEGALDDFEIPPLLLVTFVENAFKHGINATYRQAWADIRLQISGDGTLSFRVENSKPPSEVQFKTKKHPAGIGLDNTRRRLNLLFPGRHSLTVTDAAETFTINLMLQLAHQPVASGTRPTLTALTNGATYL